MNEILENYKKYIKSTNPSIKMPEELISKIRETLKQTGSFSISKDIIDKYTGSKAKKPYAYGINLKLKELGITDFKAGQIGKTNEYSFIKI